MKIAVNCPSGIANAIAMGDIAKFRKVSMLERNMATTVFLTNFEGTFVVIKRITLALTTADARGYIVDEIAIQIEIIEEGVVGMYGAWKDARFVYIALQYAHRGDMFKFLTRIAVHAETTKCKDCISSYFVSPSLVAGVVKSVLTTLVRLHARGIIHRDIKPDNLLLDKDFRVLLADFGLAVDTRVKRPVTKRVGTCDYMAPEIVCCAPCATNSYTEKVDVWSTGIVAYEMLFGCPPFYTDKQHTTFDRILKHDVYIASGVTSDIADFVRASLQKDPSKRPSAAELLEFKWMQKADTDSSRFKMYYRALA